ncbi:MAG: hypothetical protein JWO38_8172 [Gemmataceae bacterium]|nr:hypothetical protein [Gemmataceae bacterium]
MGKLILILGVCLVAGGGAAFGLYQYADLLDDSRDPVACHSAGDDEELTGCCCHTLAGGESSGGIAVAGPVALFATSPVTSNSGGCCATTAVASCGSCRDKADPYAACCDLAAGTHGLEAVAGVAVIVAKK